MIIIADPWHSPFLKDAQILWKSLEVYEVWNCKYMRIPPAQPRPLFPLFPEGWEGPQGSWDLDSTAGALNSGRLGLWAWRRRRRHGFLSFSQRNEIHRKKIWLPDALLSLWLVSCLYLYVTLNGLVGVFFRRQLQDGIGLIWRQVPSHDTRLRPPTRPASHCTSLHSGHRCAQCLCARLHLGSIWWYSSAAMRSWDDTNRLGTWLYRSQEQDWQRPCSVKIWFKGGRK